MFISPALPLAIIHCEHFLENTSKTPKTHLKTRFLHRIREQAERYGICKIVPPQEWCPPCKIDMKNPAKFPTKLQQVNALHCAVLRCAVLHYAALTVLS